MDPVNFWSYLEELARTAEVVVDRPRGSAHPRYPDFIYPFDYGYLKGTTSADGGGMDVWIGSLPGRALVGIVCCVDLLKRDSEIKLLLGCTREEAEAITRLHQQDSQSALLVRRENG